MSFNQKKRLSIRVYGLVQGVFFRSEARKTAKRLGLTGWVKNLKDGAVWIVAEGPKSALSEFEEWCKRGSKDARVEKIKADYKEATGNFGDFEIRF
jgi:acylphosphatase